MAVFNYLVEGDIDEAVAVKLILATGHEVGAGFGKRGFGYIKEKIRGFNSGAIGLGYLALVDFMDTKRPCPGDVVSSWLPDRNPNMLFRVVVPEVESWLMADSRNLASFLRVPQSRVPASPDRESDPKRALINVARTSRTRAIRETIVPLQGSTAQVGTLYNSEMKKFVTDLWDPNNARLNSPHLDKCMLRLEEFCLTARR